MTVFKDIKNNEYVANTEIKLTEGVNGEKSLTGTIYFGNDVKNNLSKGWTMVFNDEEYAIVTFRHNDTDNTVSFSAVQMFFYTLSVKVFHEKWNGSHPLNKYLDAIFKDTGYSYNNETSTAAFEKENWGLKDKLSLFNDIINQISAEFEVQGTTVYIKNKIGSDLSTVVRQGFNLSTAKIETDNSSFATYGVGYGAHDDADDQTSPRLSVEYYSPLYDMYKDKFGTIEAQPVDDERYTVSDDLLAAVKKKVDNSWSLSITVSLLDLQNAGYPYAMASAGDSITIVDESLNFEDEVRIIKVVSSYNISGERVSVEVTCGDLTMAQSQSASSSVATSAITDIINGNSTLPDAWFSEQMQLATNSILAARTELKFTDQGIIAIDKSDHNKMVILNSAGIGVSTDGGQTFKTAITADSIDGQNINIKNINANNITSGTLNLSYNGRVISPYSVADKTSYFQPINGKGKLDISYGYVQSTANLIYYNKINKVMKGMADSWGYWKDSVTFVPDPTISNTAESTLTAGFLKLDIFDQAKTHVVSRGYVDGTGLYINSGGTEAVNSMLTDFELLSSGPAYLMGGVRVPKSEIIMIGNLQINGHHTIASNDGRDVYFKKVLPKGSAPVGIHAKSFTKYSQLSIKTDISDLPADEATRMLNSIDVEKYRYTSDGATYKYQYGAVIDDINELGNKQYSLPAELLSEDGTGVNLDSMIGILIKTVQDQNKKIGELSLRLTRLETK